MRGWREALGLPPTCDTDGELHRIGLIVFYVLLGLGTVALLWSVAHAS